MRKPKPKKSYFALAIFLAAVLLLFYSLSVILGNTIDRLYGQNSTKWREYYNLYSLLVNKNVTENTLIILANNAEIRTGGGFIGTVGLLNSNHGKVNIEPLVGVYAIDSGKNCDTTSYTQVEYLKTLSPCPSLRDSSNSLDFSTNAKEALYFYQLNVNKPVKNVVQITPEVLEKLLEKLGPVYLKDYDITVTKDNFRDTVQLEVEAGKDKQQKKDPKSGILGSLANSLVARLINQDASTAKGYINLLNDMIQQKHLVMFSENQDVQRIITKLGANGDVNSYPENYYMFAEANFSAKKNSPYIKNDITMHQTIEEDGQSTVEVKINTTHTSDFKIPYIDPNTNQSTWLVARDDSFVSNLLPKNSTILSFEPEKIKYDVDSTTKGTLLSYSRTLEPLQKTSVSFRYRVPTNYSLSQNLVINTFLQKQVGGWPYTVHYSLSLANDNYKLAAANVKPVQKSVGTDGTVVYTGEVNSNQVLSFIYEKIK